jgi:hypothetical protein
MAVVLVVRIPCCSIQRLDSEVNVKNRIDNQTCRETNDFISLFIDIGYININIYIYEIKHSHPFMKFRFIPIGVQMVTMLHNTPTSIFEHTYL